MKNTKTGSFGLDGFPPPPPLTDDELSLKIAHLRAVLERRGRRAILLTQEGAVRWLSGTRHQIIDIAPDAESPVSARVTLERGSAEITFCTTRIEMPRIKDQLPGVFDNAPGISLKFQEVPAAAVDSAVVPGSPGYAEIVSEIVAPVLGDENGNQMRKLDWLHAMATAVLTETALQIAPGMNGAEVRGLAFKNLAAHDVECNLVLVALAGQEKHFHPLYSSQYRVEDGCWIKLVGGCRYAELIVSVTVMAKAGKKPSREESLVYGALQQGTVEYADLYRSGAAEKEIYAEVGNRFMKIEKDRGLKGFHASAYFHHMGGPTSPLGNRDYLLQPDGTHVIRPLTQFAINPCDVIQYTKAEVQGIVMPQGAPRMLDGSRFVPAGAGLFSDCRAEGGTMARVGNIVEARQEAAS